MVLNPRQRHEQRRCLPPGTKERNQKVLQHLGLAHCVATRQRQRGPEVRDDLLQEACLGLIQGVENLNPSRGFRPSSYLMTERTVRICTTGATVRAWFAFLGDFKTFLCRVNDCKKNGRREGCLL